MSKPSLLAWEQGVDNRFNTSVDQSFEDLVGDTEQGDGAVALWVIISPQIIILRCFQKLQPFFKISLLKN